MPPDAMSTLDPKDLRRAFGSFATGVAVVAARAEDGRPVGLTVNSFTSVSLDPPMALWCLAANSPSFPAFASAPAFAVSILTREQQDLCGRFARPAEDKFEGVSWRPGPCGAPVLNDAAAFFECRRGEIIRAGDHWVMFGEIVAFGQSGGAPLVYCRGGLTSLPAPAAA